MKLKYSGLVIAGAVLISANVIAGNGEPIKGAKPVPPKKVYRPF